MAAEVLRSAEAVGSAIRRRWRPAATDRELDVPTSMIETR
jgi:hypothetical protein